MDLRTLSVLLLSVFAFAACTGKEEEVEASSAEDATGPASDATSSTTTANYQPADVGSFPNARRFGDWLFGGQPSEADLEALAAAGVKRVIDLRADGEDRGFDEPAACAALGLVYENVPYSPKSPDAAQVARALEIFRSGPGAAPGERTLVHCASGNRVALLFTVHRVRDAGADAEAAIQEALAAGMSDGSAEVVRTMLGESGG